jgi:acetyl-CoA C-acetyltransferase
MNTGKVVVSTSVPSIVIVSMARTPIGKFLGSLSSFSASELGALAIRGAMAPFWNENDHPNIQVSVSEALMGNVVSAGIGQAPARQAIKYAGMDDSIVCTTINKVCASGIKSIFLAAQTLQCQSYLPKTTKHEKGQAIIAGGMESMSNIPHYFKKSRSGISLGHAQILDGCIHDGLWDPYNNQHMGMCAEVCAKRYGFSREEQDVYALESYRRAQQAIQEKYFQDIVPVEVKHKHKNNKSEVLSVHQDEEPFSITSDIQKMREKLFSLRPAFDTSLNGTITAGNSSSLNDGAAAFVLMLESHAKEQNITPLARILGYADVECPPIDFTIAPSLAIPKALQNVSAATLTTNDVDYYEINEAFAVVALANIRLLGLDPSRVNAFGGAVALGHPIGMSGARIVGTLYQVLKQKDASIGCASICNGGGGASAIVIERLH